MGLVLLLTLEKEGVKKCGVDDVVVLIEFFNLSAAGGQTRFITRVIFCL